MKNNREDSKYYYLLIQEGNKALNNARDAESNGDELTAQVYRRLKNLLFKEVDKLVIVGYKDIPHDEPHRTENELYANDDYGDK